MAIALRCPISSRPRRHLRLVVEDVLDRVLALIVVHLGPVNSVVANLEHGFLVLPAVRVLELLDLVVVRDLGSLPRYFMFVP